MDKRIRALVRAWHASPDDNELRSRIVATLIRGGQLPHGVTRLLNSLGYDTNQLLPLMLAYSSETFSPLEEQITEDDNLRVRFFRELVEDSETESFLRYYLIGVYKYLLQTFVESSLLEACFIRQSLLIESGIEIGQYGTDAPEPPDMNNLLRFLENVIETIGEPDIALAAKLANIINFFYTGRPRPFPESFENEQELYNIGRQHSIPRPGGYPELNSELFCFQQAFYNFLVGLGHNYPENIAHPYLYRDVGEGFTLLTPAEDEDDWEPDYSGITRLETFSTTDTAILFANMLGVASTALLYLNPNACRAKSCKLKKSAELEASTFDAHSQQRDLMEEQLAHPDIHDQIEIVNTKISNAIEASEAFDKALATGAPAQKVLDKVYRSHGFPESSGRSSHSNSLETAIISLSIIREKLANQFIDADQIVNEVEEEEIRFTEEFNKNVPEAYRTLHPLLLEIAIETLVNHYIRVS